MDARGPVTAREAARPPLRMPILLGTRAFRRMAFIPALVLIASALSQLVYLVGPDLPHGEVWWKIGYSGLVLSLCALVSPFAVVGLAAFGARSARRAWSIRACDVVFEERGIRVVGGPAHGFSTKWELLAVDGVQRTGDALVLRGVERGGQTARMAIPWSTDAEEKASMVALADTLEAKVAALAAPVPVLEPPDTPHCSQCGAALRPAIEPVVACGYCGKRNELAPALVGKVRATASIAERRRRDALLANALLRQQSAHAANVAAFVLGGSMMCACVVVLALSTGFAFSDGLEAGLPRLGGLPVIIVAGALAMWAIAHAWLSNRRALQLLTLGFPAIAPRRPGEPPGCHRCGAPLPDPGIDSAITVCAYCATPCLLAADLRVRATRIEALAKGDGDPWTILQKNRRRRRISLGLGALAIGLATGGTLWLRHEHARGAIADARRAAHIPFENEKVTLERRAWKVTDRAGVLDRVACFDHVADLQLMSSRGKVDTVLTSGASATWTRDIGGAARAQRIPLAVHRAAALDDALFVLVGGKIQRFDEGDAIYPTSDADPLVVDLVAAGHELWFTTRASRHGHLRVRRHDGRSVSDPLVVDAREPALSPDGSELAFVQVVAGKFQLVVAGYERELIRTRRQLTKGAGHVAYPTWSPNGRGLLVMTRPVRDAIQYSQYYGRVHLWLVPREGGEALMLTAGSSLELERPAWTAGGIWFVANTPAPKSQRCVWRISGDPKLRDDYMQ